MSDNEMREEIDIGEKPESELLYLGIMPKADVLVTLCIVLVLC